MLRRIATAAARHAVSLAVLAAAAMVLWTGAPFPAPDLLATGASVIAVLVIDWARTAWYERRLARKRALLRDALATLRADPESPRSTGASAQD